VAGNPVSTEPTVLFSPDSDPVTVPYADLPAAESQLATKVDRGSRAETVTYGGGLRATSRRIAAVSLLALVIATALGVVIFLVNAQSTNSYSAAVVPANVVQLNFAQAGPLAAILVTPGERVRAGEVLARQDDTTLLLSVDESKLAVSADKARLAYLRTLDSAAPPSRKPIVAEEISQTISSLAEARLSLAIAHARLEATFIRSPIDGTVLRTAGTPGELVGQDGVRNSLLTDPSLPASSVFRLFPTTSGASTDLSTQSEPVISLVSGRRWQLIAAVPEGTITSVHPGMVATFRFATLGGVSVPAVVRHVVDVPFEVDGQISYEVLLQPKSRLPAGVLPGMSGNLSLG
jgi:multidrug resistance efflux pump